VLKTSISDTNTSLQTFTPFTGASFINNCLLQPILHVNHPLLQFADITHCLQSTAVLLSRFYSHRIQTWAIKAALSYKMNSEVSHIIIIQYAIEIGSNCNCHVSQVSVARNILKVRWRILITFMYIISSGIIQW